jgi:hypothetical protein
MFRDFYMKMFRDKRSVAAKVGHIKRVSHTRRCHLDFQQFFLLMFTKINQAEERILLMNQNCIHPSDKQHI